MRREFDTVIDNQAERILRDLDVVQREEFEAVKEMARLAREENEALKARIAALEAKRRAKPPDTTPPSRARTCGRDNACAGRGRPISPVSLFCRRRRYKPAARGSRHPWRHAAVEITDSQFMLNQRIHHGDRQ